MANDAIMSNLERVRSWKGRIMVLNLSRDDVANQLERAPVTISRWMKPDKYGLPLAADIDRVEKWLAGLEVKKARADARAAKRKAARK